MPKRTVKALKKTKWKYAENPVPVLFEGTDLMDQLMHAAAERIKSQNRLWKLLKGQAGVKK